MCPKKYTHGFSFLLFCLYRHTKRIQVIYLFIHILQCSVFFRVTSLTPGQSCDCPGVIEVTLKGKNSNITWTLCMILGTYYSWRRYRMETLYMLLAPCEGNSRVTIHRWFPSLRASCEERCFVFSVRLNIKLGKQWSRRWFKTPWRPRDVSVMS